MGIIKNEVEIWIAVSVMVGYEQRIFCCPHGKVVDEEEIPSLFVAVILIRNLLIRTSTSDLNYHRICSNEHK